MKPQDLDQGPAKAKGWVSECFAVAPAQVAPHRNIELILLVGSCFGPLAGPHLAPLNRWGGPESNVPVLGVGVFA